jgi:Response regulator containing CheY-like receiver domain and AraC-type DNA-binding domain
MKYYGTFSEVLEDTLESISRIAGCQIGLVTHDYNWVEKNAAGECELCRLIHETREGRSRCDGLSWRAQMVATSFKQNYIYKCHANLVAIVVPIYKENKYLGCLYCGIFLDRKPDEKGWEEIALRLPAEINFEHAREVYMRTNYVSTQRIYDLQKLLGMLSRSVADLIDMEHQRFSSYDRILEYIDKNFQREISLCDLGEISGFNASYISQLFPKKTGLTLTGYISRVRIEKAKGLLRNSDISIGEVAFAVGFKDQNYFSRVFRDCQGVSPKEYRKQLSGNA